MVTESPAQNPQDVAPSVEMPSSTAWPITLAFGITLLFAGLVTSDAVSWLGALIAIGGVVGWFRDVFPVAAHESVPVDLQVPGVSTRRHEVARSEVGRGLRRAALPVEIYPISAGVKGGLAGGFAMALLAILYGIVSRTGIWYPINLLAAGFVPGALMRTTAEIGAFHLSALLIAVLIHSIISLLVGLLYGATLPMLPRRPIVLGGFIAPILWTGLVHSILGIVNPVLNQRIDWLWFVVSQIGFGVVAGLVVSAQERIRTEQPMPLALRMGFEESGMRDEGDRKP